MKGDSLAFYDGSGAFTANATAGAVTATPCDGTTPLVTLALDCGGNGACLAAIQEFSSTSSFIDLSQQSVARHAIRNNHFHENRGNGSIVGLPFGEVLDNTYFRNSFGTITLAAFGGLSTGNVLLD